MKEFPRFAFSVSYTTRKPREGEVDGTDYHFVDHETFLTMKDDGKFAEWAEVHGNYYGTPRKPVQDMLTQGKDVLFDIDVQGAMQLRESFPSGLFVFLLPPSKAELERRLRGRGTDADEQIALRLSNAEKEVRMANEFDYLIINGNLEKAYDELRAVYLAGRTKPGFQPLLIQSVLGTWK